MSKNNFKRTNVDVETLQVSAPNTSSFDLSKNDLVTIPFGKLYPIRCAKVMAGSLVEGSLKSDLNLENFVTPMAGRMRLDQHVFVVSARRIFSDWRQWFEQGITNAQSLPAVNLRQNAECYLNNVRGAFDQDLSLTAAPSGFTHPAQYFVKLLTDINIRIVNLSHSDLSTKGNLNDYWYEENERINDIINRYQKSTYQTSDPIPYMTDLIHDLLLRVLGEGSVADNLGYDIYPYFSDIADRARELEDRLRANCLTIGSGAWNATSSWAFWSAFQKNYDDSDYNIFSLGHIYQIIEDEEEPELLYPTIAQLDAIYQPQCEDSLRANYAVWYDCFRNYHLEKNSSCLNPDSFTTQQPLIFKVGLEGDPIFYSDNQLQLLAPRCRNWSRDMFTMIQPDDYYRHVQAPAVNSPNLVAMNESPSGHAVTEDFLETVVGLSDSGLTRFPFPLGSSFIWESMDNNAFFHDLQTMRRANMLENYLRRNYYNPDTYVGVMEARYGTKPLDFSLLTAQYVGGSEQMISGSQLQANLGTSETPAGQRTLTANAGSEGSFSYAVSDPAYVLSYVGIMPLVHYNCKEPHLSEIKVSDNVVPEFADDARIGCRSYDFLRGLETSTTSGVSAPSDVLLGFTPRYYPYRHVMDGVHGAFLREYRSYTWLRDSYALGSGSITTKNAINERVHLPLDCFAGKKPWDFVARGSVDTSMFVQCALPSKVEFV